MLRPGEALNLPKGVPHAFRKVSPTRLPETDCHFELREALLKSFNGNMDALTSQCLSIAFDFTSMGSTLSGCRKEMEYLIKAVAADPPGKVLCNPKQAMYRMARQLIAMETVEMSMANMNRSSPSLQNERRDRELIKLCYDYTERCSKAEFDECRHLSQNEKFGNSNCSDAVPLREGGSIELPGESLDGGDQYFCQHCEKELSNAYLRCVGCQHHVELTNPFHICLDCFEKEEKEGVSFSHLHHVQIRGQLPCETQCISSKSTVTPLCNEQERHTATCKCGTPCILCMCTCHQEFQIRYRFMVEEDFQQLQQSYKNLVAYWSQGK